MRTLIESLCHQVKILVLHDFDKSGFSIVGTLRRDTRRYEFAVAPQVVDLGLQLSDVCGIVQPTAALPDIAFQAAGRRNDRTSVEDSRSSTDLFGSAIPAPIRVVARRNRLADSRRIETQSYIAVALAGIAELGESPVFKSFHDLR